MKLKRFLFNLIMVILVCNTQINSAQNSIRNPSFEEFSKCPITLGNLQDDVVDWDTPTLGSTDYFNGCSTAMGTPKNFNGEQPADFGVGYIGLYFYAPDDYREYVQGKLMQTLTKGETYRVSFYVSLAERSDFAIKEFGLLFSENPIDVNTRKTLSKMHLSKLSGNVSDYIEIKYSDFYSDKTDWVLVETEFVAEGTENYMIIGNFKDNKRTHKFKTKKNSTQGSYYYLDMVSVNSIKKENSIAVKGETTDSTVKTFKLDEVNVFENVLFDFDAFQLLESAKKELNQIQQYLSQNQNLKIMISGHTDDIGSKAYNLELSKKRAKAVNQYLIENGLSEDRISFEGYGSSKPIGSNTTSAERKQNRRVEFVISK